MDKIKEILKNYSKELGQEIDNYVYEKGTGQITDSGMNLIKNKISDKYAQQIANLYKPPEEVLNDMYEALKEIKWRLSGLQLDVRQAELTQRSLDIVNKALAKAKLYYEGRK